MVNEIPGFYFDPEKGKYFKIEANHVAPSGTRYTHDSVKRKREDREESSKKANFAQRLAKERIVPSSLLRHPLIGIDREIGVQIPAAIARKEETSRTYVSQMKFKKLYRVEHLYPPTPTMFYALREPHSGALVTGDISGQASLISICWPEIEEGRWTYNHTGQRDLTWTEHFLSSMSLSSSGIVLSTFETGPDGDAWMAPYSLTSNSVTPPVKINLPPYINSSSSAARPSSDKATFAIGTSGGLCVLEGYGGSWDLMEKPLPKKKEKASQSSGGSVHSTVSSVDWMSQDVVACGLSDSDIFLHDLRSGGSATRLRHPHTVHNVRKVDEYRLVASGFSCLQMYDLRFPVNAGKRKPSRSPKSPTRPYLTFPEYSFSYDGEMDLSPELNLLATSTKKGGFELFSLQTGRSVPTPAAVRMRYRQRDAKVCLYFEPIGDVPNQYGPQTPSLLVGSTNRIDQWIW